MPRIIIFANGELPDLDKARTLLQKEDYIICADGGTRHALALHVRPDLIIGDMDSTEKDQLRSLKEAEVSIELFPHDKNETDLELAIHRAIELSPTQIIIIAGRTAMYASACCLVSLWISASWSPCSSDSS